MAYLRISSWCSQSRLRLLRGLRVAGISKVGVFASLQENEIERRLKKLRGKEVGNQVS
jgi:hypothetical protein